MQISHIVGQTEKGAKPPPRMAASSNHSIFLIREVTVQYNANKDDALNSSLPNSPTRRTLRQYIHPVMTKPQPTPQSTATTDSIFETTGDQTAAVGSINEESTPCDSTPASGPEYTSAKFGCCSHYKSEPVLPDQVITAL